MRGDGRIFKRGRKYWIAYYVKKAGKSVEEREPGGSTEKAAKKKLRHRRKEIGASELGVYTFTGPESERVTVDELLADLEREYAVQQRDLKKSKSHMKPLRAFFGVERAVCVTSDLLNRYIMERRNDKAENSTINRELNILRRAFNVASSRNPSKLLQSQVPKFPARLEENVREGFTGKAELDVILASLTNADVRDYVAWAFWTGMRKGEIAKLTWAAFDKETSTLILPGRSAKTRKPRKFALEGIYREIIKHRQAARVIRCELIFHRHGMPMGTFRKAWSSACKKAGVPGLLFHDLRRTALRNMIRAGVEKSVAKKISGHRTDSTFDRYNIGEDEDLREAACLTEEYVSALPTKSTIPALEQTG